MIANIILLAVLAAIGWQVYETVKAYMAAEGSPTERLKAAFKASATIAWSRVNALSVAAVAALSEASVWLGMPGVKETIEPYLGSKYMLAYVLVVAVGAEVARRRSLRD